MSNQNSLCDNLTVKYRLAVAWRWWILAFIVSLVMFSSTHLFLGGEAQAQQLSEPAVETVKQQSEPVEGTTQPVTVPVPELVEQTVEPVQQAGEPVEQAVQSVADPIVETVEPVVETVEPVVETVQPVVETVQPVVAPVVETVQLVADPVVDTLPIVDSVPLMTDPVSDALPEGDTMPVVQPVVDALTPPQVDPAAPGQPVAGTLSEPTTPVVGTLQPANPLASLSTMSPPVASSALESASVLVAGGSNFVAQSNLLVGLSSSSYGSVEVFNSYSPNFSHSLSYSLLGDLLTDLDSTGAKGLLNQTPQPFSPGVPPASSSSLGSSSSYGGSTSLLAILALFSLLLLGGKGLRSIRELPKPNSVLISITERPG